MAPAAGIDASRFARHFREMALKSFKKHGFSFLLTAVSCLALSACQSQPSSMGDMPSVPVTEVQKEEISANTAKHIIGLETRVATLEKQMRSVEPAVAKVNAIETHFRALSLDLQRISNDYKTAAVTVTPTAPVEKHAATNITPVPVKKTLAAAPKAEQPKPKAKPAATKTPAPKPVVKKVADKNTLAAVTAVRIGEQKNEVTRIVLDTTKPAEMRYDIDNGEHILLVDLPKNQWNATKSMTLKNSPMVKSFTASHDANGAHLVVVLKQTAKVATTARLNPSGPYGNRVYLDIVPAK